ncbi:MAG TPA: PQQ-binding-like beta-propeller repeat protein [Chloroflexota bacterium]
MRRHRWHIVFLSTLAAIVLLPTSPIAQAQTVRPTREELAQTRSPAKEWFTHGGAMTNQRFSNLTQINTTNVSQLRGAWLGRLGSGLGTKYKFEADPLVVDGVMYVPSGNDDIFALDPKTGRKLWEYFSDIPQNITTVCCGWDNRGVAVGEGLVFSASLEGAVFALDQKTGKIAWKTQLEAWQDGYTITGPLRYFDGMVFSGMSGSEYGVRGRVYGLDAKTGREVWRFYTIPGPGDIGHETWASDSDAWTRGGGTVWQAPAIDADLGMLYFSTGNAGPDYDGSVRPGDNLFTASIVALDYKSGQYRWHFQEVHHEIWDYDAPSPVVLFDQEYNGQMRKGLYQAGKTGWLYFLDRSNGRPLIGIEERAVPQEPRQATAATQPYPVGDSFVEQCGEPIEGYLNGCIFDPFWDLPVNIRPGTSGGSNWAPTAYSPQTGYVYVTGISRNSAFAVRPQAYTRGQNFTASGVVQPIGSTYKGTVTAMDSRTNKLVWQREVTGDGNYGALATAGGLVFSGGVDGNLVAYDAQTGQEAWKFQVGWGITAPPISYEIDGQQYIAVVAGSNSRSGPSATDGDAVWTFSLNGVIDQVPAPPPPSSKVAFTGPLVGAGQVMDQQTGQVFDGTIEVAEYRYLPTRTRIPVGTTVTFANSGGLVHTATEQFTQAWDTGDIAPGEARSMTFNSSGTYTYYCIPHPWMQAQLVVQ